jgi:hypothetical protein
MLLLKNFRKQAHIEFLEPVIHQEVKAQRVEEITLKNI